MPDWYVHLAWATRTPAGPDTSRALTGTLSRLSDIPGVLAYATAPHGGVWRAGLGVTADSIDAACASACTALHAAALHAGQEDVRIVRAEILDESQRDRWGLDISALPRPDAP